MQGRVIQGFFIGGAIRMPGAARSVQRSTQPVRAVGVPGPPAPSFDRGRALQQRPAPGPPAPLVGWNATRPLGGGASFAVDPVAVGLAQGGGQRLPEVLLAKMEAAVGADFSAVRIHVGPQAARIGALAFTTGNDIYFAPGRYQPGSVQGQTLLGHELAHVIQQRQGRVRAPGSGVAVVQDRALEAEADRLGMRAAMHLSAGARGAAGTPVQPKLLRPGDVRRPALPPGPPAAAFSRLGNAVQRSSSTTSTYTLKGEQAKYKLEKLGQFVYLQGFSVNAGAAGYIIQRIRRKLTAYAVYGGDQTLLSTSEVEGFSSSKGNLTLTGWEDYYELFDVDSKGASVDLDGFILTQINPDTKHTSAGQYEISGEAYFVSASTSLGKDWKKGDKSNPANGLCYIQNAGSASSLPAPESNVLKRTVSVTWFKSADAVLKVDGKIVESLKKNAFPSDAPIQP